MVIIYLTHKKVRRSPPIDEGQKLSVLGEIISLSKKKPPKGGLLIFDYQSKKNYLGRTLGNPFVIQFQQTQTAAVFGLITNQGTSTFTALLNEWCDAVRQPANWATGCCHT